MREYSFIRYNLWTVEAVQTPALFLWVANYANSCSLQASGITLTYVVKACIPVFTVLACAAKGQRFSSSVLMSLLPICAGVGLASGSDLSFCYHGLAAALCSAIAQTMLNISIKEVTAKSKLTGPQAFLGMSIIWYDRGYFGLTVFIESLRRYCVNGFPVRS